MEILDRFVAHLGAVEAAMTTVRTYRNRLARYVTEVDPLTIDTAEFAIWFAVYSSTRKPATVASYLGTVRSFHRWLVDANLRDDNPTGEVDSPRVTIDTPAPPPLHQILRVIDHLDVTPQAIVSIMFGGLLRVEEALSLKLADVDLESRRMIVTGKGGKRLPVPIPTGTVERVERHLERSDLESPWLFPGERVRQSGHRSYTWLVGCLRVAALELELDPEVWTRTHLFRHAGATELMRRDVHLRKLQRLLRHTTTKHTERYLHAVIEDLAAAIDEHHPLSSPAAPTRSLAGASTHPLRVQLVAWAS